MAQGKFDWEPGDLIVEPPPTEHKPVLDPREAKYKRLLIKTIFAGDKALYDEFLTLYDAAVARGSGIPYEAAMIEFRKKYLERTDGTWVKR